MRIIVTGGRDYRDHTTVARVLGEYAEIRDVTIVHGGAPGLDTLAEMHAAIMGYETEAHYAQWDGPCTPQCWYGHRRPRRDGSTFCPAAGVHRNQQMINKGADLLLAFPGGDGTADCVRRARTAGIPVREVQP